MGFFKEVKKLLFLLKIKNQTSPRMQMIGTHNLEIAKTRIPITSTPPDFKLASLVKRELTLYFTANSGLSHIQFRSFCGFCFFVFFCSDYSITNIQCLAMM